MELRYNYCKAFVSTYVLTHRLRTDANGEILLGECKEIEYVTVDVRQFNIISDYCAYPGEIHAKEGDIIK